MDTLKINFYKMQALFWCLCLSMVCCQAALAVEISDIQLEYLPNNQVRLHVTADAPIAVPTTFSIDSPPKLVFDFLGVNMNLTNKSARHQQFENGVVRRIVTASAQGRTRILIDLVELRSYDMRTEGNDLYISLSQEPAVADVKTVTFNDTSGKAKKEGYQIKTLDFRRGPQGEGRLMIGLSDEYAEIDVKQESKNIYLRFAGATVPADLERLLDVKDFGTPIQTVRVNRFDKSVEMVINATGIFDHIAYQADKEFILEIKPLSLQEQAKRLNEADTFTGEKLSLNFQNIEVRAVLQMMADFTGLNIVASDTVTGNVTLRLANVPWDQALELILKSKGLAKRQHGNVLLIAPAQEITEQEKQQMQAQKQVSELAPLHSEFIQINYAKASNIAALLKSEKTTLMTERGTVSVDERTNTLLVQDTAQRLDDIRELVHRLDVPVRQVLIETRIVEASDNFDEALGLKFGGAARTRRHGQNQIGVGANIDASNRLANGTIEPIGSTPAERLNVDLSGASIGDVSDIARFGLTIARLPGDTILDLELRAMESEGVSKIVGSPRLVTSDQKTAYIESGEEIPYLESTSSGAASIAFRKAVLRLEVTPQITPDGHIVLDLKVNQDSKGDVIGTTPAINTKEIQTSVIVNNGETVVLGGVYKEDKSSIRHQVPGLSQLPVIGNLFKNKVVQDHRTELLIFVTPKIIVGELNS